MSYFILVLKKLPLCKFFKFLFMAREEHSCRNSHVDNFLEFYVFLVNNIYVLNFLFDLVQHGQIALDV